MASVYKSARRSTASVLDFVGTTAQTVNSTMRLGADFVRMGEMKVDLLSKRVEANCIAQEVFLIDNEILQAAVSYVEMYCDANLSVDPSFTVDKKKLLANAVDKIRKAHDSRTKT